MLSARVCSTMMRDQQGPALLLRRKCTFLTPRGRAFTPPPFLYLLPVLDPNAHYPFNLNPPWQRAKFSRRSARTPPQTGERALGDGVGEGKKKRKKRKKK